MILKTAVLPVLKDFVLGEHRSEAEKRALSPTAYWSPYAAGILLGATLFLAFFIMGRGLGASGSMNRIMAWMYGGVAPDFAASLSYYAAYFRQQGSVLYDYAVFQLLGTLVGGYVSAAVAHRSRLTLEKGPNISARGRLWMAFGGGFMFAFGARLARGCTSGQVLTGSANLAIGSLIMFVMFFLGAYVTAYVVRKQWI